MALIQELPLVSTIATGLGLAFGFGMVASKLRIPPIVGYLLAGIIIGPYTPGYVGDTAIAEQLAEIGIVLLMFGVGLHFSLDDLKDVRRIALPGAIVQIGTATALCVFITHYFWGWDIQGGLMFGLALSVASTVVLLRALDEHNQTQTVNGRIAVGWLIVEDLVMVLALVLIPALAGVGGAADGASDANTGGAFPWSDLGIALVKIAAFLTGMVVVGKRFLPWLLTQVVKTQSRELFTLAVFAVTVGLAYMGAKLFGVSLALGAFFAGMMIRESDLNHEVADRALPFQDAFAVLFFVAVGMLFNPAILMEEPMKVLIVVGIVMFAKSLAAFLLVITFRYPLKTALLVSSGLAQIGEFSFILSALGVAYGLLPEDGRNLILAGAIISIALNPLTFLASRVIYEFVGRHPRLSRRMNMEDGDAVAATSEGPPRDLVLLVGYGRVGKYVSRNMTDAHVDLVVIDANRARVDDLRQQGFRAVAGDATHSQTLQVAAIHNAVAIVVAVPDPFEARRVVDAAHALKPDIKVLVYAHNEDEMAYFRQKDIDLALTGPEQVARGMVDYLNGLRPAAQTP